MATERVKIAEIDIGVDKLLSKTGQTKKEIFALQQANKDLKKDTDNLKNATQEQLDAYAQNEVQLKNLRKQYSNSTKVLDAYINIQNQDIRTKDQARDANRKLIAIANQLDATNEDQAELLSRVNKEIDQNTEFIKENASEYEKTKINIGNYKESIKDALRETGLFGEYQEDLNNVMVAFQPVYDNLKQDFREGADLIKFNSEATKDMTLAQKAWMVINNLTAASLKVLRVALIGTGIGAFVVVLGSLIAYLATTQEGIDKVNKFLAPMKEIFSSLLGVVQDFGKEIFDALSNPKQLIKDLGNLVKENLLNRFEGFLNIIERIKNFDFDGIGDDIIQTATGVENAAEKVSKLGDRANKFFKEAAARGREIENIQQTLNKSEAEYIRTQAELRKEFEQQKKLSEDVNKTIPEREAAAKRAIEAQEEIRKGTVERLELEAKLLELKQQANDTSDAEKADLARKLAEIDKALEEEAAKTTEAQNKLNSIRKEGAAKQAEYAREAFEEELKRNELAIKTYEAKQGYAEKTAEQELTLAREVYEKQLEIEKKKLEAGKITQEELNLFILENQNELARKQAEIAVANAERELEIFKQSHQSKLESNQFLNEQLFEQEQERLNRIAEKEREFQQERLDQGIIDQQEYNDAIAQVNQENYERQEDLRLEREEAKKEKQAFELALQRELDMERFENQFELEREREQQRYEAELAEAERLGASLDAIHQKHANVRKEINEAEEQAKLESTKNTFGEAAELLGERTAMGKAAGIAEATISTYQGVSRVWESPSILPEPFATAQKVVSTGVVLGSGLKAVKKIASTQVPRAERGIGMDLQGPSHSHGGINLYDENGNPLVNAQGGEKLVILKREATKELNALSALNEKHGGVSLSKPVTYANNGGAVVRQTTAGAKIKMPNDLFDYEMMGSVIAERMNAVQVAVPVDQVVDVAGKAAKVEQGADL